MSAAGPAPSGEQVEIRHGSQRAVVVEVGGGLREYLVRGSEVLAGYAADEMCPGAAGQLLVPWPNRLADGRYEFRGSAHQVALTEPERRNAIHGLLRWASWSPVERAPDRVVMRSLLHPQPGYPFTLEVEATYALGDAGLDVTITARNLGPSALPYGAGQHPYLAASADTVDGDLLTIPAAWYLESDERQLPTGRRIPLEGTEYDFRVGRAIGPRRLDLAYGGLQRDAEGRAWIELASGGGGRRIRVWLDRSFDYVMAFSGDTLSPPWRRRTGLGVEPMTCPPNAFASGVGIVTLEPGESTSSRWGIQVVG